MHLTKKSQDCKTIKSLSYEGVKPVRGLAVDVEADWASGDCPTVRLCLSVKGSADEETVELEECPTPETFMEATLDSGLVFRLLADGGDVKSNLASLLIAHAASVKFVYDEDEDDGPEQVDVELRLGRFVGTCTVKRDVAERFLVIPPSPWDDILGQPLPIC